MTSVVFTRGMIYRGVVAMSESEKKVLESFGEDGAVVFVVKIQEEAAKTDGQMTLNQLKKRRWSKGKLVI